MEVNSNQNNNALVEGREKWKIWPMHEVLYIECINTASLNAIKSWEALNEIISDEDLLRNKLDELIDLAENIVNQAGIISKYFFPPVNVKNPKKQIHKLRGEKLREAFGIDESQRISDRTFRNYIEHFDEKLDLFLENQIAGNIIPPKLTYVTSDALSKIMFVYKAYIINEFKYISLNEQIVLPGLVKEIYGVHEKCLEFMNNGGRLKRNTASKL